MAKNLFVVNSPLHLMSAFILANSKFVNGVYTFGKGGVQADLMYGDEIANMN